MPMHDSPAAVLVDETGTKVVGVILDGLIYRLQVEAQIAPGSSVAEAAASVSAVTDVPASIAPVVLLAANPARLSVTIYNDSNRMLTVKCGASPTATSRTSKVHPQMEWFPDVRYTGVIEGFWAAGATGSAAVTEYTP